MSDDDRRRTDPLVVEIHGMMRAHLAHYEEHVLKDDERHADLSKRLEPVEELNSFIRVILKVGAAVVALGGVGGVVTWLRYAATQVPVARP